MAKQKKTKIVLIGDTHPEMFALSKELQTKKVEFRLFLSFYLTRQEFQKISNNRFISNRAKAYLRKRILSSGIESSNIFRDFAIFELLLIIFDIAGFISVKNTATRIAQKIRQFYLSVYLFTVKPQVVIIYDNLNPRIPKSSKLIVIALMAHPLEVQSALLKAESDYPEWPKTVGNLNSNYSQIYARATRVITLSNYANLSFIKYGISPERLLTVNLGPKNVNRSEIKNFVSGRKDRVNVLFVGQINLRKGVPAIINAASQLERTHDFKIVGPSLNSKLADYLAKTNLPKNLKFVENPTNHQLNSEFGEAEVFVFPSYSEGFSLACIEAMSYGLIPVLSKNSGVSEALMNTGLEEYSINAGSVEDIVEKLSLIRELPDEVFYNLRNLSIKISRNYSLDRFAQELLWAVNLD